VDDLTDRNLRLDGVAKSNEFLMTMALHVAADDRAVEDVESSEVSSSGLGHFLIRSRAFRAISGFPPIACQCPAPNL
jgi:hypothetical protein